MADNVKQTNNTKGSEEVYDNCCSPCLKDGKKKEARKYCVECGSYVCDQCVQDHNKFLALRSHQIMDKFGQEPEEEIATDGAKAVVLLTRCATHHGKLIDKFCGEHKELCCESCVAIKHRSCKNVDCLRSFAKEDFKDSGEYKEILEIFENVKTKATEETTKRKEYLDSLNREKEELLQNVQKYQDDIINKIKEAAENSRQKILARHEQYKASVDLDIAALDTVGSTMDAYSRKLSGDDAEKLFLNAQAGKTAAKEGEGLISELPSESNWKRSIPFSLNLELKRKVENFEMLAEMTGDNEKACDFIEHMKIIQQILKACHCSSLQFLVALLHLYSIPLMGIQSGGKMEHIELTDNTAEATELQGFLKTSYECRKCQNVSESTTSFHHLSIPVSRILQEGQVRRLEVFWFPADPSQKPVQYKLAVPKNGCVADICDVLSVYVHVKRENMVVTDVYNHRFHKVFVMSEAVSQIMDRDDIFIYQVAVNGNPDMIVLPIYMREQRGSSSAESYTGTYQLFGQPLFIEVPRHKCTYTELYNLVLHRVSRFVSVPDDGNIWWRDESTSQTVSACTESPRKIFRFSIVNSYGTAEMDYKLLDDGSPLKLTNSMYISVDWCKVAKAKFYNDTEADSFEIHETMKKAPGVVTLFNNTAIQCFEQLTAPEDLGNTYLRYCHKCKEKQPVTLKTDLWSLPNILMIHLDKPVLENRKEILVDFPTRCLDLRKYVKNEAEKNCQFDLIGVVNHDKKSYTCYCRNFKESTWYYLDQTGVRESTEDEVVTENAYGLVYQRREQ